MEYRIIARTPRGGQIAVFEKSAKAALAKVRECQEDGLTEVSVLDINGRTVSIDELAATDDPDGVGI